MKKVRMRNYSYPVLLFFFISVSAVTFAQSWSTAGRGVNGPVSSMAVYNNKLYVGGEFTNAGGIPAKNIAVWDGTKWDSVGSGVSYFYANTEYQASVNSMCVFKGCLYVSGNFTLAGNQTVNCFAVLCNSTWYWAPNSMNNNGDPPVARTMIANDSVLYAACGSGIMEYNGTSWPGGIGFCFPLDFACINNVSECLGLALYNNSVIISGQELMFTTQVYDDYLTPDTDIVSFNGSGYYPIHVNQTTGGANALMSYNGNLYSLINGNSGCGMYLYNGNSWNQLGGNFSSGYDDFTSCLNNYRGHIFVGGNFSKAGNVTANKIIEWNGTGWSSLTSGIKNDTLPVFGTSTVNAMAVYNGQLYVAGNFDTAGGLFANNIARWTEDSTVQEDVFNTIRIFPNPNNGLFYCTLPNTSGCYMMIYNISGKEISEIQLNTGETEINIQDRAEAGMYLYRIISQEGKPLSCGKFMVL